MTVLEILNWATDRLREHRVLNPRLNAELLLARCMNVSREGLYAHLRDSIPREEREELEELIRRRTSGEPLQYILGHQEFWSIDLSVDPRVLIPRPETELLVEEAVSLLSQASRERARFVLEIGTGSGAIAIALAKELSHLFIAATDISGEALIVARQNAARAGVLEKIAFVTGDLFGPYRLPRGDGGFDLILSNPPYVARKEIDRLAKEVKDFEPTGALNGGEDGLDFYRRITSQGPSYLRRGGWLLLEMGQGQGERVTELIKKTGVFSEPQRLPDLSGIERVVKAQKIKM